MHLDANYKLIYIDLNFTKIQATFLSSSKTLIIIKRMKNFAIYRKYLYKHTMNIACI